jgi:hypothetical protein
MIWFDHNLIINCVTGKNKNKILMEGEQVVGK